MTNKTFIPAFKAKVGDWEYYICIMKYAEVARQVSFSYEVGGNADLNTMIQRGIGARTSDIKEYILKSEHRFLGSLIIAAWGGAPEYNSISMDDPEGILKGIDRNFGVLSFDGTQQYFALDGQHRLRAIKEAVKVKAELGREDICVIMVSHFDTAEGNLRTRRLFTNINRNAKATTGAENIVLDEDDGPAIITRRLLTDHSALRQTGIVKVFTKQGEEGEIKLAAGNVSPGDKKAFTTIINLYDMVRSLCFDLDHSMRAKGARPNDTILEQSFATISTRLDDIIGACGKLTDKLVAGVNARELRAPKGNEAEGTAFMRPVVQKAVVRVVCQIAEQGVLSWSEIMKRLTALKWRVGDAPWSAVYNSANNKMITAKENVELLDNLIYCHLAASSKDSIKRARKEYKELRSVVYPFTEEQLQVHLTPHTEKRVIIPELESSIATVADDSADAEV